MAEHPPAPGPFVTPNFLAIEEALATITFPIGRRDLLEILGVEDEDQAPTALVNGRNVDLVDLVAEMPQDWFESEEDFESALERHFGLVDDPDPEPLPTGPTSGWQADTGPGAAGGPDEYIDPPESL